VLLRLAVQRHRELVGRAPTIGIPLWVAGINFACSREALRLFVEPDHVDAQFLADLRDPPQIGRQNPPEYIGLDGLTVRTHRSMPSGPLVVELAWMEGRQLSWQRGETPSSSQSIGGCHGSLFCEFVNRIPAPLRPSMNDWNSIQQAAINWALG
jgi:hypothetical protein